MKLPPKTLRRSLRPAAPAVLLLVLAGACSSSNDATADTSSIDAVTSTSPTLTEAVDDGSDIEVSDVEEATSPTVPSGPTTTFIPNLEGPFSKEGGAVFAGTVADELIVDESFALPDVLAQLTWPTDWSRRTVEDWNEFGAGLRGNDPRDGIPPIDNPIFESTALARQWLGPREPGAVVAIDGDVRFYPLSILTRHEIVNDAFGDRPVAVTFCPLCNTALAFDRRVDGETLRFGVSGLLRNSDLVMWDDQTTSLWQQISGEGVVGQYAGAQLEVIPTSILSWQQFLENYPEGRSLAAESGGGRGRYGLNPYRGYSSLDRPFLFDGEVDDRLPALSRVVGISVNGTHQAFSFDQIAADRVINTQVGGVAVSILWAGETADALDDEVIGISQAIGSAVAYLSEIDGQPLDFAPGGEDGIFMDRQTESTWTISGAAVEGPLAGSQLEVAVHRNEFWFAWQAFFGPDSLAS